MTRLAAVFGIALCILLAPWTRADTAALDTQFLIPPRSAMPWAVGYWLDGNITKAGITADLEAMQQSGIAGFSFMDCGLGNPPGPQRFMSASWQELFRFMLAEAHRLGLRVDLNDGPGWAGSGGPWIKPEQSARRVIVSETILDGPARSPAVLPTPAGVADGYYRDIAVLAYPAPAGIPSYRLPGYDSTKSFSGVRDFAGVVPWPRFIPTNPRWPDVPDDQCIKSAGMADLTAKFVNGRLEWDVPPGRWLVLRFGCTVANGGIRAGQPEAQGLECDKLSPTGMDAQFSGMVAKLTREVGDLTGQTLVSTHIDSWESGSGNWTDDFRAEFLRRRGYDLLPFLPTLNGVVVDSRDVSERFLWDFRETIAELVLENYAGGLRALTHAKGMQLSIEAYDGTVDDLRYGGRADEPMGEFWQRPIYSGSPMCDLAEEMASAAHVYGHNIVGAEAFTAIRGDFLDHPAVLKPLADWAFCTGINKLYLSEWVMQPFPRLAPGVSFDEFGTVFHRSLPWWPMARAWNDYLGRCQFMLRQGRPVADICYLAPEGAPLRFTPPVPATQRGWIPDRPGYNYDSCPAELILDARTHVEHGAIVLPSGMRYRVLVLPTYNAAGQSVVHLMGGADYRYRAAPLPKVETMTPQLLSRLEELVRSGATILGPRPRTSPSLVDYPRCDAEVARVADALWGKAQGFAGSGERNVGQGHVVWGTPPEAVLRGSGLKPDFDPAAEISGLLNYTHRRDGGTDIYFLTNKSDHAVVGTVALRVSGRSPELWWPETGAIAAAPFWSEHEDVTELTLSLRARESVFVVFRGKASFPPVGCTRVTRNGETVWPRSGESRPAAPADDSFTLAAWVKPLGTLPMPEPSRDGWAYRDDTPNAPGAGYQTYTTQGEGRRGFAVGANGVVVYQYGADGSVQPLLVYRHLMIPPNQPVVDFGNGIADADIPSVLIGVVYANKVTRLYVGDRMVLAVPNRQFPEAVAARWEDTRPFAGDLVATSEFDDLRGLTDRDGTVAPSPLNFSAGEITESGTYAFTSGTGKVRAVHVEITPEQKLSGPWDVAFAGPAPCRVQFEHLENWADRAEPQIKYYSGIATYRTSFVPAVGNSAAGTRVYLELGDVRVIARVTLNGTRLGTVWTSPYRLDVTGAIQRGTRNELTIEVANLWVNRLIGDAQLPSDAEYSANGALKSWPSWVLNGESSPTHRQSFTTRLLWRKDDPLVKSGLLGPVRLVTVQRVALLEAGR